MPSRQAFDRLWMDIARRASCMSKDPSTKVGAALVLGDRQVSLGYNGMPSGIPEEPWMWQRPVKYSLVKHAEENAIIQAPFRPQGATIYVTHQPCTRCLGLCINAGVARVVYDQLYANMASDECEIWEYVVHHTHLRVEVFDAGDSRTDAQ